MSFARPLAVRPSVSISVVDKASRMLSALSRHALLVVVLAGWILPSFAISQAQQHPPAGSSKDKFKAFGEPTMRGFLTGNDFRRFSEPEKTAYLMGIWDGYMFAPAIGGRAINDQTLHDCIPGIESDQLLAIVNKYMDEHPERWGDPMNGIVFGALPANCRTGMVPY
jgi:hypothetical protein